MCVYACVYRCSVALGEKNGGQGEERRLWGPGGKKRGGGEREQRRAGGRKKRPGGWVRFSAFVFLLYVVVVEPFPPGI